MVLTGDLIRVDTGDCDWRDALVHAWLVSAVNEVPDVNAAILFSNVEH